MVDWWDWEGGAVEPPKPPEWMKWRSMGFHPVWFGETLIGGGPQRPDAWQCKRGCGTLVWDPAEHTKNVCKDWEPVVGKIEKKSNPTPALVHYEDLDGPACGAGVGFVSQNTSQVTCKQCDEMIESLK